jgi:hypothetical protein
MAGTCPICERRRGKRFCPGIGRSRWGGKSETICAQCCGEQREVTIDCPAECPYLAAAHRYEAEKPRAAAEAAFPDIDLDRDFLEEKQHLIVGLSLALVRAAREHSGLRDPDALAAVEALARSYQTLDSGLYYEQSPEAPAAQAVYAALKAAVEQLERELRERTGSGLRPGDVLRAAVFLRRLGQMHGNGRALSRRFLDFLRAQLPGEAAPKKDEPRIIVPGR